VACCGVLSDLDRGLVPRDDGDMNVPWDKRRVFSAGRAREIAEHDVEVARLQARVKELEEVNATLGKAIGLLHQVNEQEPGENPTLTDPLIF